MLKKYWAKIKKFGVWKSLLIVVLVPNIVYWGAVRPVQVRLEYRQFQQAEQEIEALSQKIIEKTGTPTSVEKKQRCGYSSAKFSKGTRRCHVGTFFIYKNVDVGAINSKYEAATELVGTKSYHFLGRNDITLFVSSTDYSGQEFSQNLNFDKELGCQVSYSFTYEEPRSRIESGDLKVSLSCSKETLAEYYPVTD